MTSKSDATKPLYFRVFHFWPKLLNFEKTYIIPGFNAIFRCCQNPPKSTCLYPSERVSKRVLPHLGAYYAYNFIRGVHGEDLGGWGSNQTTFDEKNLVVWGSDATTFEGTLFAKSLMNSRVL